MPRSDVKKILEDARARFVFSGAQLYAWSPEKTIEIELGDTSYWPDHKPITAGTYFDIGSVSKVVATTSILARLFEKNAFSLATPLSNLHQRLKGTRYGELTPLQILSHTAGALDWYPLYKEAEPGALLEWFLRNEKKVLLWPPGSRVVYSDLGFLLLWEAVREIQGSLQSLFENEVRRPLCLEEVCFGPIHNKEVASTEYEPESKAALTGIVFDENARWLGGSAPHAGLFGTARGLALWCKEWLNAISGQSGWITRETAETFIRQQTPAKDLPRGIGFDLKSKEGSSAGTLMSQGTFGHLGYTGCSVWIDPRKRCFVIFLTNRVHPLRVDERIRELRPIVHDAVIKELGGGG